MDTIILTIVSLSVGVIATYLFSRYYYVKAGKELKDEAKKLRKRTDWILLYIINKGNVRLEFNKENEISNVIPILEVKDISQTQTLESVTLTHHPPK
jgi:hypothetical protein